VDIFVVVTTIILIAIGLWQVRIMKVQQATGGPVSQVRWYRRYWPILIMFAILLLNWVPYFMSRPAKDVLMNYGMNGDRIFAQVDSQDLGKTDRLLMIARPLDNSIDFETDKTIARSATFPITTPYTNMEMVISKEFAERLMARPYMIGVYIYEVPREFPFESVKTIADAEKLGARHLADKSFGPVMLPPTQLPRSQLQ
jgi:hypothetical protein